MVLPLLLLLQAPAVPDAREIIRRSVENDSDHWQRAKDYTFIQRVEERRMARGKVKSVDRKAYEVTILFGRPYRRLFERDGRPLPPDEERKEQQKLTREFENRRRESDSERSKRLEKFEKERREQREFAREIPEAYDFRIAGEEMVEGRPAWLIDCEPRPGYRPRHDFGRILPKFRGRVAVDQQTYQWARLEAESIGTVSFCLFLARLNKGAQMRLETVLVNDEVRMARRLEISYSARLALLRNMTREVTIDFSNYRKFSADAQIVNTSP